jgi:hypothetical protein
MESKEVIENRTISIQNSDDNSIQRYEGAIIIENFCLAKQDSNGAKSGLLEMCEKIHYFNFVFF